MVPSAVEGHIGDEVGAAIMWLEEPKSVKQMGGKVPSGAIWGQPIRKMLMFDNLISNGDRNAGNILIGQPGEFFLIDHSRAFVTDTKLLKKVERVDATPGNGCRRSHVTTWPHVLRPGWTTMRSARLERRNRPAAKSING